MTSQRIALRVAGVLFALVCLGHAWRVMVHAQIRIGTHEVPMWPSAVAIGVAAALALWMLILSSRR